jgi:hypothetical protein
MADEKYTHKEFASPGGPDPSVDAPEVGEFPKMLHGPKPEPGEERSFVIVLNADEEAAELASGLFKHNIAEWDPPKDLTKPPQVVASPLVEPGRQSDERRRNDGSTYTGVERRRSPEGPQVPLGSTVAGVILLMLALLFGAPVFAQTAVTQTTLGAAVAAPSQGVAGTTVTLASATGVVGPTATAPGSEIFVDQEAMLVQSIAGTVAQVTRGYDSSVASAHNSGAIVYVGPASGVPGTPFVFSDPAIGPCTASNELYTLRINTKSGRIWQCTAGYWANVIDAFMFIPAQYCQGSVSGNSTGTNGYTVVGTAPSLPVVQDSTSATGTNTHYYVCSLIPDTSRFAASKSVYIVDAEFYYGVQTTALGTQAAVLASGTMNAKNVFSSITYPVPGASETATGMAEAVRADAGTLAITPVVASFNVATTTAGEFFSAKFTPATPIIVSTDHQQILLTVSLLNTATSATVTNSPGILVHYRLAQGL